MTRTIRGLLLSAATIFVVSLFVLFYFSLSALYERSVRADAVNNAGTLSKVTFNSMFQLMSTGWRRDQLEGFILSISEAVANSPTRIELYRGVLVSEQYGAIEQGPADATLREAMLSGQKVEEHLEDQVRFVFPLLAETQCLKCHANARIGDPLGAIDVRQSVGPIISENRERFALAILPAVPITFVAALLMVGYINRRLRRSIESLGSGIATISRVADLRELGERRLDLGFAEFDLIGGEIRQLTERLRSVAVDREMLEFEIRLLEKFIITSEVVLDWRDYVCRLLAEINNVVPTYALFSVFKTEEDHFDLEVFWLHKPADALKGRLEATMTESLRGSVLFGDESTVRIAHHVTDPSQSAPEASVQALQVQTKSLVIDSPKIGGIVGIGVQSMPCEDAPLLLVIESTLATLMNVVGSVKAIHRYTTELEYHATRDPLTGLYNQRVFWELLDNEVARATRRHYRVALLLIDVDNFKSINDGYGHGFGDLYLKTTSRMIRDSMRVDDTLARYGGDEFVAILPCTTSDEAGVVAARILDACARLDLVAPDGRSIAASVSMGMAVYPDHAGDKKDLFLFADNMMYRAKSEGKNRLAVPTAEDLASVFRIEGEMTLRVLGAIEQQRVEPFFQPIMAIGDRSVAAVEVLCRLRDDDGAPIAAQSFVHIAERMGLMHRIDQIVMQKALTRLAASGFEGLIFLNTSPKAIVTDGFIADVERMARGAEIANDRIVFEITERETIRSTEQLDRFVGELKEKGFKFAIDDFGSGFSSFHYVKRFPIDFLKIEGEFIVNVLISGKDRAMVRSIVALARELGISTVAEHVESEEILQAVAEFGIDHAQGYHIGRPAPEPPPRKSGQGR